jgi:protein-S-isoprenylcysteine O-methyltransferase Ste14
MGLIMLYFVGAIAIAGISWRTFGEVRSHGFMRFLAFEAIWAALVLNLTAWFRDPFSWNQIISWTLLFASGALAIWGFTVLKSAGKPLSSPHRKGMFAFEETTRLVTTGPYRHIRHPLYASLLLFLWGTVFKSFSFFGIVFGLAASFFLYVTAHYEELENLEHFGEGYDRYMQTTKMFVPGLL